MYNFDSRVVEQKFLEAMRRAGCSPVDTNETIFHDGKIHRFRIQGDKSYDKSGAYCLFDENWPAGWFQNWRTGVFETWSLSRSDLDDNARSFFNDEHYKEARRLSEEHQKKAQAELLLKQHKAILDARQFWKETETLATCNFPYLELKQVGVWGGIKLARNPGKWIYGGDYTAHEQEIILNLTDINGDIQSLQFIHEDGRKRFFTDAPVKGAFFSIGFWDANLKELNGKVLLICEGYATAATLYQDTHMPVIAAMNAGNIYPVAKAIQAKLPQCKIIIAADNDWKSDINVGLKKAREACEKLGLQGIVYPPFTTQDYGSDWNDYEALYGQEVTAELLLKKIRFECLTPELKEITKKVGIINAQDLRHKEFKPINWAIPEFIPSGLTVLAGGPKVGKSLLALHLALGVAIGGRVLSQIDVQQGDVLYLALEDTERRLQERINGSIFDEKEDLSRLDIVTSIPRQDEGGLDFIRWWLSEHKEAKLVIVDTLQKFRKLSKGKLNVYAEDYETLSELKKVADEFNVAFVVIHHLKKMSLREEMTGDWINHLSGSAGITGCADTILCLRRERSSTRGVLRRTGRDVEEKDFNMKLDGFGWALEGEMGQILEVPEWKQKIYEYLKEHEKITPMQLSEFAKISIEAAKKQLQRGVQERWLKRLEHGVYTYSC